MLANRLIFQNNKGKFVSFAGLTKLAYHFRLEDASTVGVTVTGRMSQLERYWLLARSRPGSDQVPEVTTNRMWIVQFPVTPGRVHLLIAFHNAALANWPP